MPRGGPRDGGDWRCVSIARLVGAGVAVELATPLSQGRGGYWRDLWPLCSDFIVVDVCLPSGDALGAMPDVSTIQQLGLPVADGTPSVGMAAGGEPGAGQPSTSKAAGGTEPQSTIKPFILSEGLPPVPHKLAARILKGEFIDMAELLRDNLEAQRRTSAAAQITATAPPAPKSRREIPDLMSWVQCFGTYIAVVTSKFPHRIKELLAYQTLIIREARRCGGRGWLAYDSHFRQQVVGDESADWSRLNPSLYAVTFITQGDRDKSKSCSVCLESDHTEEQCALYSPPTKSLVSYRQAAGDRGPGESRGAQALSRGKGSGRLACFAWNQGDCRFPACKYRHICVRCSGDHRITRCPWVRPEREDKQRESKSGDLTSKRGGN